MAVSNGSKVRVGRDPAGHRQELARTGRMRPETHRRLPVIHFDHLHRGSLCDAIHLQFVEICDIC
jgi:hypothetical protein